MVRVRSATAADAAVVGEMLGDAFSIDPAWAMSFPDPATRPEKLRGFYRREVQRHPERVDVATEGDRVLGALVWEPPADRSRPGTTLRSRARGLLRVLTSLPAWRGRAHGRAIAAYRPSEPHWYFHDIAVGAHARGKGVGSALLLHRVDLIDRDAPAPVFLEATTPGSRRLYERFGFRAVGVVATQPGHASTPMIRQAAAG